VPEPEQKITDYAKRIVDAAPELTIEQRDRLSVLLRGGGGRDGS
jgi:hypothetical protein